MTVLLGFCHLVKLHKKQDKYNEKHTAFRYSSCGVSKSWFQKKTNRKGKTMRKIAFVCVIAAFLLPGTALADSVEGVIETINATDNTLLLTNGKIYKLPGEFDYSAIQTGMRVLVFYDADPSGRYVTDIEPLDKNPG